MIRTAHYNRLLATCMIVLGVCSTPLGAADIDRATVVRVTDGDTIVVELDSSEENVRLIGIDAPEAHRSRKLFGDAKRSGRDVATIQHLGNLATEHVHELIERGDRVELKYGPERRDRFGRLLAFVFLRNGDMLNEVIVCDGYASAYTRFAFREDYRDRIVECEREARRFERGLWGADE